MNYVQLQQRDNEIQILVAFIRKREAAGQCTTRPMSAQPSILERPNSSARPPTAQPSTDRPSSARPASAHLNSATEQLSREVTSLQPLAEKNNVTPRISKTPELQKPRSREVDVVELKVDTAPEQEVLDKDKAFEQCVKEQFILHSNMSKSSAMSQAGRMNYKFTGVYARIFQVHKGRCNRSKEHLQDN